MKIRNLFEFMGFRGKPRHFTYKTHNVTLENTVVCFAKWLHPHDKCEILTAQVVDEHRKVLKEGDFCIDIGAYTGDSTLPMALAVGVTGCVLALEPNPFIYHVLEKNTRANAHITNIKTMMAAASDTEGFVSFEYSDSGFGNGGRHEGIHPFRHGHPYKLEVFCVNLEQELYEHYNSWLPKLKFIKVDAEGYDLYIIKSMRSVIEKYRPTIRAEVLKRTSLAYRKELLDFFVDLDYRVYRINEGTSFGRGPLITSENISDHRAKTYDLLGVPD